MRKLAIFGLLVCWGFSASASDGQADYCVASAVVQIDNKRSHLPKVWQLPGIERPLYLDSPSKSSYLLDDQLRPIPYSPPSPFPRGPIGLVKKVVENSGRVIGISLDGVFVKELKDLHFRSILEGKGSRAEQYHRLWYVEELSKTFVRKGNDWYTLEGETLVNWPEWGVLKNMGVKNVGVPIWLPKSRSWIVQTFRSKSAGEPVTGEVYVKRNGGRWQKAYTLTSVVESLYLGTSKAEFFENADGTLAVGYTETEGFLLDLTTPKTSGSLLYSVKSEPGDIGIVRELGSKTLDRFVTYSNRKFISAKFENASTSFFHLRGDKLEPVPGGEVRIPRHSGSLEKLWNGEQLGVWAVDGLWLYDGHKVRHVSGSDELDFTAKLIQFRNAEAIQIYARTGFFELTKSGELNKLSAPFQTSFGPNENGQPAAVYWAQKDLVVFLTTQGVFTLNREGKYQRISDYVGSERSFFIDDVLAFDTHIYMRIRDKFIQVSQVPGQASAACNSLGTN